jgi:hypothetical protein
MRIIFEASATFSLGRDSAVGIATRYGLDGPGIESRWRARFSTPVQTDRGTHPASYEMGTGSFSGVKRPGCCVDYLPPSSAEVKERVELYFYSPFGPSWTVLGRNLPLSLHFPCLYLSEGCGLLLFMWAGSLVWHANCHIQAEDT